ncbi:hypothetical protein PV327_009223 [Microctonus hyperodae]|uniref:Exonuclease domain-containing protein n=1 Tax=Microctonus hyperodae TaxID=165561 RepID=A0AA39FU09_MICHY|nr:hypothetical protein PV327_009223 [Microctonus hyperodae]
MSQHMPIVFFDLETTGAAGENQIVQIAATSNYKRFNVYILPTCDFQPYVSNMTGLQKSGYNLYLNSAVVPTKSAQDAIAEFITFLRGFGSQVILAAHGGKTLDFPKIIELVKKFNMMYDFSSVVYGFVDTLTLLQSKFGTQSGQKFSLLDLAVKYQVSDYHSGTAHDASKDAAVLEKIICERINLTKDEILKNVITIQQF